MPLVFLKYPIVKHYAGSVFDIDEGFRQDSSHPILVEKQTPEGIYFLPDDGKGRSIELSFSDVGDCPAEIFKDVDLCSGPGRITSVKPGISNPDEETGPTLFNSDMIKMKAFAGIEKQLIEILWPPEMPLPMLGVFYDRKLNLPLGESMLTKAEFNFDISQLHPGFYEIQLQKEEKLLFRITFIKCFPRVVNYDHNTHTFEVVNTIW